MALVIAHAELVSDQTSDPRTAPQRRREAVRLGAFQQQRLEAFELRGVQQRLTAGAAGLAQPGFAVTPVSSQPLADALPRDLQSPRCLGLTTALLDQPDRFETALLQGLEIPPYAFCISHTYKDVRTPKRCHFILRDSISNGYAQSLFVGVQRALTSNWSVEINHLASLGRKLITTDIVNRQFSVGRGGDNPQGRLNPELPDISYRAAQGASNYHALTAVGRYRSRRGFVQLAYTWSHVIDNQSDPLLGNFFDLTFIGSRAATGSRGTAAFSRQFDSAADRGSADFDQRHNLVFYSGWDVPALFSDSGVAPLFRNWRFAQVAAFRSGFPYSVFAPTRSLDGQGQILNQRADLLNPSAAEMDRVAAGGRELLDPAAFSQPARGTLGNTGRNAFSGPGLYNVDLSISRVIPARWLGESGTVTLRADIFNVFNHANLNNPDALVGSSNFGFASYGRRGRDTGFPALTPLDETPRQIQLMVRFEF